MIRCRARRHPQPRLQRRIAKRSHARTENRFLVLCCRANLALMILLILTGTSAIQATDSPQWRGPNRDAVWTETGILQIFPAEGLKVRWRAAVGPGWSSPVVAQGRGYLTDMRLEKPRAWERIQRFKESTGKPLWSRAYELGYPDWAFIPEHCRRPGAPPNADAGKS